MKTFRLHLWREWREHRATLFFLALALPVLAGLAALRLPRRFVGDPWMAVSLMAIFVVVVLAAIGGELLGRERRGPGLRWLERLPGGLGLAFAAKLGLHLVTCVGAGLLGFACALLFARLHGRGDSFWTPELRVTLPAVVALSAWTFACSAWALRGGTAILAAGLVLGLAGYPVGHVLVEGYHPTTSEILSGSALAFAAGLVSAGLAFLLGNRRSSRVGRALFMGSIPVLPLALGSTLWSAARLDERARIDPLANDFTVNSTWSTADGQQLFLAVHHWDGRWDEMPIHVLALDLTTGAWHVLARDLVTYRVLSQPDERGLMRPATLHLALREQERELVLDLREGSEVREQRRGSNNWSWLGQGQRLGASAQGEALVRDPFRGRDYPTRQLELDAWDVYVRPGDWLIGNFVDGWSLYDPDLRTQRPLLAKGTELLAMLPDGRLLLDLGPEGVVCLEPETGERSQVLAAGTASLLPNDQGFREPWRWEEEILPDEGPIVLSSATWPGSFFVLDPGSLNLREIPRLDNEHFLRSVSDHEALTLHQARVYRLDLATGARTQVFPPELKS